MLRIPGGQCWYFLMKTNEFFRSYGLKIEQAIQGIDYRQIESLADCLWETFHTLKQVFLCGNGGSAANALHIANDFLYGIGKKSNRGGMRVHALTANQSILTCLANDIAYDEIFSCQLAVLGQRDDILIALSGSGNSQNIVNAIKTAKSKGMKTFAILGYNGGRCLKLVENPIHFRVNDMQISEDMQLIVGHMIMQWIENRLSSQRAV